MNIVLASLGEAYLGQLAHALRLPPSRVLALLEGKPPAYSRELSAVQLGLAEMVRDPRGGRVWRITPRGRRKARSMTSAKVRGNAEKAARGATESEGGAKLAGEVSPAQSFPRR